MGPCSVLLKSERTIFEMFFRLFKSRNQNIINVQVCVDLNPMSNENQRWLSRFGDCSPHHEWKRLLLAVDCSHGLINDCWRFYVHSVVLIGGRSFNCEKIFTRKNNFSLCCASFQISKKNICCIKSSLLLDRFEVLSLFHL